MNREPTIFHTVFYYNVQILAESPTHGAPRTHPSNRNFVPVQFRKWYGKMEDHFSKNIILLYSITCSMQKPVNNVNGSSIIIIICIAIRENNPV